jgi:hypothetical protein
MAQSGHGEVHCKCLVLAQREQRNESGTNCNHDHDSMAVAQKSLGFLDISEF